MIADQEIVERGGVDGVAIGIEKRSVVVAIHGELGMAMDVTPIDLVSLAIERPSLITDAGEFFHLLAMNHGCVDVLRLASQQLGRGAGTSGQGDLRGVHLSLAIEELLEVAAVGGIGGIQRTGRA